MIKRILIVLICLGILSGCAGVREKMVNGYKFEEVYSVGLFTPTYQYKKVSKCQVETIHHEPTTPFGSGWDEVKTSEPCVQIGMGGDDGFTADVAGPMAPAVIGGASGIASGAIIAEGLSDSGTSVNTSVNTDTNITGPTINGNQHHRRGRGK